VVGCATVLRARPSGRAARVGIGVVALTEDMEALLGEDGEVSVAARTAVRGAQHVLAGVQPGVPDLGLGLVLLGHAGPIWVMWAWLLLASPHSLGHGCAVMMGIAHLWSVRLVIPSMVVLTEPLHRCWAADDGVGACSSVSKNKGGSPRIPLKSRQRSIGCLSSLI
jgi:hypothetical protein